MSSYSFLRGRQMIIHDPRLNNPYTNTQLRPPAAYNVWTVSVGDPVAGILSWAAEVAKGASAEGVLDALHFMAHGNIGYVQIGRDGFSWNNVEMFKTLAGRIRSAIVFFSCLVGGEQSYNLPNYTLTFGNAVAAFAQCKVVTCETNQIYSWSTTSNAIDFGDFEGVVNVYQKGGSGRRVYNSMGRSGVDLEKIVFS